MEECILPKTDLDGDSDTVFTYFTNLCDVIDALSSSSSSSSSSPSSSSSSSSGNDSSDRNSSAEDDTIGNINNDNDDGIIGRISRIKTKGGRYCVDRMARGLLNNVCNPSTLSEPLPASLATPTTKSSGHTDSDSDDVSMEGDEHTRTD